LDLLQNALESIRVGVEDYERGDHERLLSAVRSIHAGILLLYKEALRRLSPIDSDEVLLKANIMPKRNAAGKVYFVGRGRKTVDVFQIQERFQSLGIATDWTRFNRITNVRNEVEHYFTTTNQKALQGLVADAFVLARDFIATQLNEDPLKLLGDEVWAVMLEVAGVYDAEQAECESALKAISWGSRTLEIGVLGLTCSSCSSGLMRPPSGESRFHYDFTLECRACGQTMQADDFVPRAVQSALGGNMYLSQADGEDTPYTTCPQCGADAYVMAEESCALCGESADHTCKRCGSPILAEELITSPLCGYCDHMISKDD
jgi:hypothetical protein